MEISTLAPPKEFYKQILLAQQAFGREQARWESLNPGDYVYLKIPKEWDNDYHEGIVKSVDVENRILKVKDLSQNGKEQDWSKDFLTAIEFDLENKKW